MSMQTHTQTSRDYATEVINLIEAEAVFNKNSFLTVGHYSPQQKAVIVVREGEANYRESRDHFRAMESMTDNIVARARQSPNATITVRKVELCPTAVISLLTISTVAASLRAPSSRSHGGR